MRQLDKLPTPTLSDWIISTHWDSTAGRACVFKRRHTRFSAGGSDQPNLGAEILARLLASVLYQVKPGDPEILSGAGLVLAVVAAMALAVLRIH
jgi:hypothetical protein